MSTQESSERIQSIVEAYANDPNAQVRELNRVIEESRQRRSIALMGAAYQAIASICLDRDDLQGTFDNALKAKELLKETDEYGLLAMAYMDIGYVYYYQERFQMSLLQDDRAYQLVEQHGLGGDIRIRALNNLASDYQIMGDSATCVRLLTECLELLEKTDPHNYMDRARYTLNIADGYEGMGELKTARDMLSEMSEWVDMVEFKALVCDYWLRRALISYDLDDEEEGRRFLDDALALGREASHAYPLYVDLRCICRTLVRSKDLERAGKVNELMLAYAQARTDTMEQLLACRTIADYYRHVGRHEQATEYYARLDDLLDQRDAEQKTLQLSIHNTIKTVSDEVNELKREMAKKEELLALEPLTQLLNRSALRAVASEYIARADEQGETTGAIFIDIDLFKECNDTYGHAQGDEIIRTVARICRQEETDRVRFARYGGDEFFGITHGLDDEEMANIARRICARIRNMEIPNEKNPHGGRVTLSVGVVNIAANTLPRSTANMIDYADGAVYQAKRAGRNAIYQLGCEQGGGEEHPSYVRVAF